VHIPELGEPEAANVLERVNALDDVSMAVSANLEDSAAKQVELRGDANM
jgi:hypothetical protein